MQGACLAHHGHCFCFGLLPFETSDCWYDIIYQMKCKAMEKEINKWATFLVENELAQLRSNFTDKSAGLAQIKFRLSEQGTNTRKQFLFH
ncbi:hypothetical protein Ahy_B08g088995 isoform D [Arachis hypogaea]|uniref:Uncharacterized protein n=1 Tax=Arachis hypogaea TaxID=3818 RepID=A0A444XWI8_ARAHY|nr:hypothetical protein Ahy_B08g088995 isoform D [Arachis hypogaea]